MRETHAGARYGCGRHRLAVCNGRACDGCSKYMRSRCTCMWQEKTQGYLLLCAWDAILDGILLAWYLHECVTMCKTMYYTTNLAAEGTECAQLEPSHSLPEGLCKVALVSYISAT